MRNVKKFLALVLAMLMVVSAAATVSAFEDVAEDNLFAEAIADLTVLEIVNGYDGETFGPEDAVTRQQFALMMARAITGIVGDDAVWAQGGLVGFEDVTEYQYAIATVVKAGIVDGFLDNTFRPDEGVTFIQALKMAVAALGYDDGNLDWWQGYYNVALDLGLTVNLNQITDADKALNRGEVAQLIWNMLYAPSANGSSLYEDIFAEPVEEPAELTTFVIVATDKQTAADGMAVTEGGYVGIQQLVNGVPTGDVYYIENEEFGFVDNEDEDAFLSAYAFANWDNGEYDDIVPVGTTAKIYSTEITASGSKFAFDGVNYYPVAEKTGTAIKNEVVVYNASNSGFTATNKQLFLNKAGQVLNPENGEVVLEAVYSVTGAVVSYRVLRNNVAPNGETVVKGAYLSIAAATEKYGVVVGETVVPFATMKIADFDAAYELTVYDDDMDGKMDRAYYTPVYAGPYTPNKADGTVQMSSAAGLKKSVTFSEELAKDDYIVYTYNKQLNAVTVLEVLEPQVDVLDFVSTIKLSETSKPYFTIETAEGEELIVYAGGNDAEVGALVPSYVNYETLYKALQHSMGIKYTARNGVIIKAEAYNIEDTYERVVVKEVVDLDIGTFYVEAYLDGALVELPVVALKAGNKTIDFANISWIKQSNYIDSFVEGGVYRLVELDNGYLLSEVLVPKDYTVSGTTVKNNIADFKLYTVADTTALEIFDNIETTDTARASRLRTNTDTVWYFINGSEIKVFSGEIEEGTIPAGAVVLADKLGYGTNDDTVKQYGVASEVYVFNADLKNVQGFGINTLVAAQVYIPGTVWYKYDTADKFDLDSSVYTEIGYYRYENIGIDIKTGAKVTVYSDKRLDSTSVGKIYTVDKNGVILPAAPVALAADVLGFKAADVAKDELVIDDTYIIYTDGKGNKLDYDKKITSVVALEADVALATKTGADAKKAIDAEAVTSILYRVEDGVLVLVWNNVVADPEPTYTAAADVTHSTHTGALEATVANKSVTTNLTATYTIYNAASDVAIGTAFTPVALGGNTVSKNSADLDKIRVRVYKLAESITEVDECLSKNGVDGFGWGLKEGSSFTDGVLTIKGINNPASSSYVFAAGTYSVEIEIEHATGAAYVVSFDMVVPAV